MTFAATVLTLYPEMFPGPLGVSLAGRALAEGAWSLDTVQIRDFATDKHRTVDDTPAGGGAGMVLKADVLAAAIDHAAAAHPGLPVLAMTPRGAPITQARVRQLAAGPGAIILCGRFEGFDERIFDARPIEQASMGDIILSGGEMAALLLLDACIRLLPGVMGAASSGDDESFENGLLEYPHYTRPVNWEGRTIPEVLRSGGHAIHTVMQAGPLGASCRCSGPTCLWRAAKEEGIEAMNLIQTIEAEEIAKAAKTIPTFRPGDTLKVGVKVVEGERTRVQNFEGVCIARSNKGMGSNFTVRKMSFGEGVERVFPLYSPNIDSITVIRKGAVRRAKLYYLRGRTGKSARIAERRDYRPEAREG